MTMKTRQAMWLAGGTLMVMAGALAQSGATVWDGVYADEQAEQGRATYASICAQCHGPTLGGIESAPPLTGALFNANWEGTTVADLAERIRVSMPVDRPGSLSRPELAALVAYILKMDGFPAGAQALDPQTVTSSPVRIVTFKP